ncbi:hypothetical protein JZU57_02000 [bacterium]|nr:hypothetical protein [bacterium]
MDALGYGNPNVTIPTRADEFRRRMPIYSRARFTETPVLEKAEVLEHNIIRFRHEYFAVPLALRDVDVTALPQEAFTELEHRLFLLSKCQNRS